MNFTEPEDEAYFTELLCGPGQTLADYNDLFDFRLPSVKRQEFNLKRADIMAALLQRFGQQCLLCISPDCDVSSGLVIDHLIPLSSNKLNKLLRGASAVRGTDGRLKKALTQSYGANHARNFVLACRNCNSMKMNAVLDGSTLRRILADTR